MLALTPAPAPTPGLTPLCDMIVGGPRDDPDGPLFVTEPKPPKPPIPLIPPTPLLIPKLAPAPVLGLGTSGTKGLSFDAPTELLDLPEFERESGAEDDPDPGVEAPALALVGIPGRELEPGPGAGLDEAELDEEDVDGRLRGDECDDVEGASRALGGLTLGRGPGYARCGWGWPKPPVEEMGEDKSILAVALLLLFPLLPPLPLPLSVDTSKPHRCCPFG